LLREIADEDKGKSDDNTVLIIERVMVDTRNDLAACSHFQKCAVEAVAIAANRNPNPTIPRIPDGSLRRVARLRSAGYDEANPRPQPITPAATPAPVTAAAPKPRPKPEPKPKKLSAKALEALRAKQIRHTKTEEA
jgi:hypothetical protein